MSGRPGKSFRVGAMRHRIEVQRPVGTRDNSGQNVPDWQVRLSDEPARFYDTGGGTNYRGTQLAENIVAVFEVHYREGYDVTQRIYFDSQYYGITRVSKVDGLRRYLALFTKAEAV